MNLSPSLRFMSWLATGSTAAILVLLGCSNEATDPTPLSLEAAVGTDPNTGARVETDQDDYFPGDTVRITGSGWAPGEAVSFHLTREPLTSADSSWTVDADGGGAFETGFLSAESDLGVTFTLTATGPVSGSVATVVFTDGNVRVKTVGTSGTPATVDWIRYDNQTCTGTVLASGSISAGTGGSGTQIPDGVSNTQSLRLTAGAVPGHAFSSWSGGDFTTGTFTPTSNPGCLQGETPARNTDLTYVPDATGPTVTINQASGQADPTNTSPINFTVVFSETVADFVTGDVTLTGTAGATTALVTGGGTTYNVAVSGTTGDGTVIATIAAGVANDAAGNDNTASTSTDNTVTFDATAPTVTINQAAGQADPTGASPIEFTAVFSEVVTGFDASDIHFTGSTVGGTLVAAVTGAGPTYTVSVTGMTGTGVVQASIPAAAATDGVNGNLVSTSTDNTVTFDGTAPTVTINQAAGQADPTGASPIEFTAVFSEVVTGFDASDIHFTGSTVGGTLVATVTGAGPTYTVSVTGMTGTGVVQASIPAAAATDGVNGNLVSTSTDNTVTFDGTAPTVTINQAAGQADPTGASPIEFTAVFSEVVTGFDASDIHFTGSTVGGTLVATVTGPGPTYTVSVTGMTGTGIVQASIPASAATDGVNGNLVSTSTDNTVTFDDTAPTVVLSSAVVSPTNQATWPVTAQFSETVTGFMAGDVTVGNGSVSNFVPVDGDTYTFDVTATSGGLVTVNVAAAVAQDGAGNGNAAATQISWTFNPAAATTVLYLHGTGTAANPATRFLNGTAPASATPKYSDSPSINFAGGNLWKDVGGTWPASATLTSGTITALGDVHLWLGLKNSDDQGTWFDLRVEVLKNGSPLASGEAYCIKNVTRNPDLAKEVAVAFGAFAAAGFNGTTDVLSLKVQTRVGTNGGGAFCGGHSNAVGLRAYYDGVTRPAQFEVNPSP